MGTIDAIDQLLELSNRSEAEHIKGIRHFMSEIHHGDFDDYLYAFKEIVAGRNVGAVIEEFNNKAEGVELAKFHIKSVLKMEDCIDEMLFDLKNGKEKGTTTHIRELDQIWTWRMNEFNLWTGYMNEGKSLFLRYISLIKALMENWKFAFYAPEDFPAKEFFDDIIHTAAGYSTDNTNANFIGEKLYKQTYEKVKDFFYFVYLRPPENTFVNVLKEFMPLIENHGVKVCVVDPLIKVARPKEYMNADDKYAGYITTMATDFARRYKISLHLVLHQLTPKLQENGLYPAPNPYYIKGGGTWADGSDNILYVWRPLYAADKANVQVKVGSVKIKKQKLVGLPGEKVFDFDRKTNRYCLQGSNTKSLFNFDELIDVPRIQLLFNK